MKKTLLLFVLLLPAFCWAQTSKKLPKYEALFAKTTSAIALKIKNKPKQKEAVRKYINELLNLDEQQLLYGTTIKYLMSNYADMPKEKMEEKINHYYDIIEKKQAYNAIKAMGSTTIVIKDIIAERQAETDLAYYEKMIDISMTLDKLAKQEHLSLEEKSDAVESYSLFNAYAELIEANPIRNEILQGESYEQVKATTAKNIIKLLEK